MSQELVVQKEFTTLQKLLESQQSAIAKALPKHMNAERMLRVALTALRRTPALLKCEPTSFLGCIIECAQLGLEPDGILGYAYLIPFNDRKNKRMICTLIPGYKGLQLLAYNSGLVSWIHSEAVYQKEPFTHRMGMNPVLEHQRIEEGDPGPLRAAYALVRMKGDNECRPATVLYRRDIDGIKKKSQAFQGGYGPWLTDEPEMWKKSAIRRLCKTLPLSAEVHRMIAQEEALEDGRLDDADSLVLDIMGREPEGPAQPASKLETAAATMREPGELSGDAAPAIAPDGRKVRAEHIVIPVDKAEPDPAGRPDPQPSLPVEEFVAGLDPEIVDDPPPDPDLDMAIEDIMACVTKLGGWDGIKVTMKSLGAPTAADLPKLGAETCRNIAKALQAHVDKRKARK